MHLKTILLQDVAVLQDVFPTLVIFQHEVFGSPEWGPFNAEVQRVCETMEVQDPILNVPSEVSIALTDLPQSNKEKFGVIQDHLVGVD